MVCVLVSEYAPLRHDDQVQHTLAPGRSHINVAALGQREGLRFRRQLDLVESLLVVLGFLVDNNDSLGHFEFSAQHEEELVSRLTFSVKHLGAVETLAGKELGQVFDRIPRKQTYQLHRLQKFKFLVTHSVFACFYRAPVLVFLDSQNVAVSVTDRIQGARTPLLRPWRLLIARQHMQTCALAGLQFAKLNPVRSTCFILRDLAQLAEMQVRDIGVTARLFVLFGERHTVQLNRVPLGLVARDYASWHRVLFQ